MVTQVSTGKDVINLVHEMTDRDNMPCGLKITIRSDIIPHDSTSIAGVNGADADETNDNIEIDNNDYDNDELDPKEVGDIVPEVKHHKQHEEEDAEEYHIMKLINLGI